MRGHAATIPGMLAVYSYVRGAEGAAAKMARCVWLHICSHVRGAEGAAAKIPMCMAEYLNTSIKRKHKLYVWGPGNGPKSAPGGVPEVSQRL